MVLISALIFGVVCCYAVPYFLADVESDKIPDSMEFLRSIGVFIENKGVVLFLMILMIIIALVVAMVHYVGQWREHLDAYIPFYRLYSANHASKLFTMLQVMISSGDISLKRALETMQKSGLVSRYINSHIDEMLFRLQERKGRDSGVSDLDVLDTGLLPPMLRLRLKNINNSGNAHSKANMMQVISESLVTDYAALTERKVFVVGTACQYGSALVVISAIAVLINFVVENMKAQGLGGF